MPLVLYQPINGYCYNSDTIFLYDFILNQNIKPNSKVLEVGSGCGILGLLLARDLDISLTQIEVQDMFYKLSCKNASINNINASVIKQDFLSLDNNEKFDFVVSNPPFYDSGVLKSNNEHMNICKINSFLPIKDFFQRVSRILNPRGEFIFCYNAMLLQDVLHGLALANLRAEIIRFVYPKKDKSASLVLLYCKKQSKSALKIKPSLIAFDDDKFSKEVQDIYNKADTYTIKCTI